jgi:2-keto-4-pentenoate hydratase/2-oxohepta-3-ene-1,7-dioic acid hydratase in catechol pathway
MRFATFEHAGSVRAGVVADASTGPMVHPLPSGMTVLDLVRTGLPAALDAGDNALAQPGIPLDQVRLLPPLGPPTVRDFVAFEEHVEGVVASVGDGAGVVPEWYQAPTFYFTNPYAMIGAHDEVQIPSGSERFDFELEVAAVVGRDGRSLRPDQAEIFGYTIMNDWSARDLQRRELMVNLGRA